MTTSGCVAPEPAVVSATRSADSAAKLLVLADLQLDSITAAGVLVDVGSFATAVGGQAGLAWTDANTVVLAKEAYEIGLGVTVGRAFACCGEEADVAVGSAVNGIGEIVHGNVHESEHDGPRFAHGLSVGFVLAASFRRHWGIDLEAGQAILGELRPTSADLHTQLQATMLELSFAMPDGHMHLTAGRFSGDG